MTAALTAALAIFVLSGATGQTTVAQQPKIDVLAAYTHTMAVQSRTLIAIGEKKCNAHKAVKFYSKRIAYWNAKMGADSPRVRTKGRDCPLYLAKVLRSKAYTAQIKYIKYVEYHWHWWKWLPDKWQRIGACETGYGKRPGNWRHRSSSKPNSGFQGAFGFYWGTWDGYKNEDAPSEAYLATPRQQYETALNVYHAHGYGAWGCGGA